MKKEKKTVKLGC